MFYFFIDDWQLHEYMIDEGIGMVNSSKPSRLIDYDPTFVILSESVRSTKGVCRAAS